MNSEKKLDSKTLQIRQQIFHTLIETAELFPDKTIAQHITLLLRKRSDDKAPYDWTELELLKKVEKYKSELEDDSEDIYYDDEDIDA